jgi:hypothetical protein
VRRIAILLAGLVLAPAAARAEHLAFGRTATTFGDDKQVQLRSPEGVACTNDFVIVSDTGNGRLVRFGIANGSVQGGVELRPQQIRYPTRLGLDSKGVLFVLDQRAWRIARVDAGGTFTGWVEAKGGKATIEHPVSFKLDRADNLYVLDVPTRSIVVLSPAGEVLRQLALPAEGAFEDLYVDAADTVFAVEAIKAQVWSLPKDAKEFKPLTASLKDRMSFPTYITAARNTLVLVDEHGHGLVEVGLDGSYLGRQLGMGWSDGLLYYPGQTCINEAGEAFIADRNNNRLQLFTLK